MYLIYTDETGTNNHANVIFSMYGGLVVHESSILKFEMQIIEIVQEFLGFKNMLETEVHFTEIFNYIFYKRKPSKANVLNYFNASILPLIEDKNKEDLSSFVAELFQLIGKANIPFLFSIIDKRAAFHQEHYLGHTEISHNAYAFKSFLNLSDRFLTQRQDLNPIVSISSTISISSHPKHPYSIK